MCLIRRHTTAEVIDAVNGEMHKRIVEIVGSDRVLQHLVVVTPGASGFEVYIVAPSDSKIWKVGLIRISDRVHERIALLLHALPVTKKKDLEQDIAPNDR